MKQRMSIDKVDPNALGAMMALENYARQTTLEPALKELIKIRASQINSCAYCLEMHTADARKLGESEARIYALSAWRESPLFTEEERALLAITEEITRLCEHGVSDETFERLKAKFDETTVAHIIMQVVVINAWNRIAIATRLQHAHQLK